MTLREKTERPDEGVTTGTVKLALSFPKGWWELPKPNLAAGECSRAIFLQQDAARSFPTNYLSSEMGALFELDRLTIEKIVLYEELPSHYSDILYRVGLKEGGEGYVYLLFEHKGYSDRWVGFQLLRYMVRIWEQPRKQEVALTPIVDELSILLKPADEQ